MRTFRIAMILVALTLQSVTAAPQSLSGTIRVTVQRAGTTAPIAGAQISLVGIIFPPFPSPATPGVAFSALSPMYAVTDENGVAVFKNLAAGRYSVAARLEGFLDGTGTNTISTAIVEIAAQKQTQDVSLHLFRGASISGRVRSAGGAPLAKGTIETGSLGYRDGHRTLTNIVRVQTDLNGDYRISPLVPGTYLIRSIGSVPGITAWFPGISEIDKAISIEVRPSEEIVGIDFEIPDRPEFRVSGTVINAPQRILPNGQTDHSIPTLSYVSRDEGQLDSSTSPLIQNTHPGPNGEFEIDGLPAGSWDVFAVIPTPNTASAAGNPIAQMATAPRYITGRAHIEIVDRDITGLNITLGFADVTGHILSPVKIPQALRISLLPRDNIPPALVAHVRTTQAPGSSGEFAFRTVPSGKYSLSVVGLPQGFYVSDIHQGSRSIYSEGVIDVGNESPEAIEVQLRNGAAKVQGTVTGDVHGVGARATLVPESTRRQNVMFYQTSPIVASGAFIFNNVPPGEYKVFAWESLPEGGAEMNANFIARFENQGEALTVAEGQTITVKANLISAGK